MSWSKKAGAIAATATVAIAVWEGSSSYMELLNHIIGTLSLFGVGV